MKSWVGGTTDLIHPPVQPHPDYQEAVSSWHLGLPESSAFHENSSHWDFPDLASRMGGWTPKTKHREKQNTEEERAKERL
jgi:hypothetical protein